MKTDSIYLGGVIILFAVYLYFFKDLPIILSLCLAGVGIALIVFWKEENKIEQRKDLITKKPKK